MFAKTLLVAFLSLSLSLSAIAAPANDFHNKGNNNAAANQQCAVCVDPLLYTSLNPDI